MRTAVSLNIRGSVGGDTQQINPTGSLRNEKGPARKHLAEPFDFLLNDS